MAQMYPTITKAFQSAYGRPSPTDLQRRGTSPQFNFLHRLHIYFNRHKGPVRPRKGILGMESKEERITNNYRWLRGRQPVLQLLQLRCYQIYRVASLVMRRDIVICVLADRSGRWWTLLLWLQVTDLKPSNQLQLLDMSLGNPELKLQTACFCSTFYELSKAKCHGEHANHMHMHAWVLCIE